MLEEQGIDNPLRRKPEVDPHWRLAWRCFSELADARRRDMGAPQRISIRDVEAWCRLHGVRDPDTCAEVWEVVRVTDRRWLSEAEPEPKPEGEPDADA